MVEIIPGVLEKEWGPIEEKLSQIKTFANSVHVDIIDGKFVDNTTFSDFSKLKSFSNDLLFEAHLMVENPIEYIKPLADSGFKRFIGHVEKMESISDFVAEGQLWGSVGLALDHHTSLQILDGINYDDLDFILIMTINAGYSGQEFLDDNLEKIKELRSKTNIPIEVDGGIDEATILKAKEAGANRFVATSFIWEGSDPSENYKKLVGIVSS